MEFIDRVRIAYKKLKATTFFDKTLLPLRDDIVSFEETVEDELFRMANALLCGEDWDGYQKDILDAIDVLVYPKKLVSIKEDTAIFNSDSVPIELDKPQFFIDLSVQGHILGVLWILTFGIELDKNTDMDHPNGMYEHSYGNRLKKQLINDETRDYTYAPGLFEPYFSQYESWRDRGLEKAKERLKEHQDALILTLDFKSFFYSVDIPESMFDNFLIPRENAQDWEKRLNSFVYEVLKRYSEKLRQIITPEMELDIGGRTVLPIGFLPSNLLANLVLTPFDNAITEYWNPVYYGRYVDDIIIVDKLEANSTIYKLARSTDKNNRLDAKKVITSFLCKPDKGQILDVQDGKKDQTVSYSVHPGILESARSKITVQEEKVKLFYFQSGATKALLNCFQSKIADNVSEFRLMPELDAVYDRQDYSEIFKLRNEDSVNKLRSVTGVEIDKFALSKFLGKYRKVGGMIEDEDEDVFARDVTMIFDERTLVENYIAWERLFEIFMVSGRTDLVRIISLKILSALDRYKVPKEFCLNSDYIYNGLLRVLHAALCRTLALAWGENCDREIRKLAEEIRDRRSNYLMNNERQILRRFEAKELQKKRKSYCETRMVNKYILPLPVDAVLERLTGDNDVEANLFVLDSMGRLVTEEWYDEGQYYYYPYQVLPQELSFALLYERVKNGREILSPHDQKQKVSDLFIELNYPLSDKSRRVYEFDNIFVTPAQTAKGSERKWYATILDCPKDGRKDKLCVAVGSAELQESDFYRALDQRPNRSYGRYRSVAEVFDTVIRWKEPRVDLLVLPENFLPLEWLPVVARICANNQMALVTGIEHTVGKSSVKGKRGKVYNLTAVILPYVNSDHKFAHISFHNKVEYSPGEIEQINGWRYEFQKGDSYQLFCWKGVWFPVYCCYELTSIRDRSIFQTYADMVVAVEWNKDVPYFSNIVESLVRDMHCYCIQSNSSNYGDSRALQPTDSNKRDIIKTKGGKNTVALIDTIDIKSLRDFQIKSIALQKKDGPYKQTPPDFNQDFNREILEKKRNGTLAEEMKRYD